MCVSQARPPWVEIAGCFWCKMTAGSCSNGVQTLCLGGQSREHVCLFVCSGVSVLRGWENTHLIGITPWSEVVEPLNKHRDNVLLE